MSSSGKSLANWLLVIGVITAFFAMICFGFGEGGPEGMALEAAEASGIASPEIEGWAWFACSEDDTFSYKVSGTNVRGDDITATVCCGIVKSCTVRY